MSTTSEICLNKGKHYGTSHHHMCVRCQGGLEHGCADFKMKPKPLGLETYSWPAILKIKELGFVASSKEETEK